MKKRFGNVRDSAIRAMTILTFLAGTAQAAELRLVSLSYPPYVFLDSGKPSGMAVDIAAEIFRRAGQEIKIEVMPWARALDEVKSGAADAIFPIAKNAEREAFLDYPTNVFVSQTIALYAKKDAAVSFSGDLAALAAAKIGIVNQMSYGGKVDAVIKSGTLTNLDRSNDSNTNMQKLIGGRFELMPSNRAVAAFIAKKNGMTQEIKELSPEIESIATYIAFAKARSGSKVREDVDHALDAMRADGSYDKIIEEYSR
jgi:polar amino acid transport system substrate-binding protein